MNPNMDINAPQKAKFTPVLRQMVWDEHISRERKTEKQRFFSICAGKSDPPGTADFHVNPYSKGQI